MVDNNFLDNFNDCANCAEDIIASLRAKNKILHQLVKFSLDPANSLEDIILNCTEALCDTLEIQRASVWFYNKHKDELIASDIFKSDEKEHEKDITLEAEKFPEYFRALSSERTIVANDARTDPRTSEFLETYLKPLDIYSMLDAPVRSGEGLGGVVCCETVGVNRRWSEDEITFVGSIADIIAVAYESNRLRDAQEHINRLAHFDSLTGLANRLKFNERIADAFECAKSDGERLYLYLIDLDKFKPVNDQYGHEIGDIVLSIVGERLKQFARKIRGCEVFRLGGDEFAFIIKGPADAEATRIGKTISRYLSRSYPVEERIIQIGVSIGCVSFPGLVKTHEEMLKAADLAMYSIKHDDNKSFTFFDKNLEASALQKKLLEKDLIEAIHNREFQLHVQPIVGAMHEDIWAGEVLIRWFNKRLDQYVSPAVFIPIAEANGLIPQIDYYVLSETITLLSDWAGRGIKVPCLSVNISPETLMKKNMLKELDEILTTSQLPADSIKIEVTEGVEILNETAMAEIFHAIRSRGLKIFIDDFGSGHTGLSYFTTIPVDGIKIDRSLTSKILNCEKTQIVVSSIINLAKAMELDIVFEGIETKEQHQAVRIFGSVKLQGFYFSRPAPIECFVDTFKNQSSLNYGN